MCKSSWPSDVLPPHGTNPWIFSFLRAIPMASAHVVIRPPNLCLAFFFLVDAFLALAFLVDAFLGTLIFLGLDLDAFFDLDLDLDPLFLGIKTFFRDLDLVFIW